MKVYFLSNYQNNTVSGQSIRGYYCKSIETT